jgi:citronellol/citronellal dehydrogenase
LPGTINTAAREIEEAGGQALPLFCDIRHEDQIEATVSATVAQFGGIDICINNAGAVRLTSIRDAPVKRGTIL